MKMKVLVKKSIIVLLCLALIAVAAVFIINSYVKSVGQDRMMTADEAAMLNDIDCIIVLGCYVDNNGDLSTMLHDRLQRGVALYKAGAAPKILMSGDHGQVDYDEVNAMKQFAVSEGVPSEDVFMDHAGFSTYETMYRARDVFQAKKVIIVTQEYHLYRAVYIAQQLGLEAYGVSSDYQAYSGQTNRDVREILARCKDFVMCIVKPEPTFLGDAIPVNGSGDLTNDKYTTMY